MSEPTPENNGRDIITFSLYSRISDDETTSSGYKRYEGIIENEIGNIVCKSKIYETGPWGYKYQDFFLNQVIQVETYLIPETLIDSLNTFL